MNQRTDLGLWHAIWPFLRRDLGTWLLALALAPLTAITVVAQPWLLQRAIDHHIVPGDLDGLQVAAFTYLAVVIVGLLSQIGHTLFLSVAATRTITHVRRAVYVQLLSLKASFFDREPTGRLLTRATSDVEALGETLNAGAFTLLLDLLQVTGVLIAMFYLDARLTFGLMLIGPPLALVLNQLRKRLRVLFQEVQTSQSVLNAWISERLDGLETVQLYADEERAIRGFDERLAVYRNANIRSNVADALMYAVVDGVTAVSMALILAYGASEQLGAVGLTAGVVAAFIDYLGKLFGPIQEFSQKVSVLQRAAAALEKIVGLLDVTERITPGDHALPNPHGELHLEHLTFGYTPDRPVLRDVNLHVLPGQTVALCGRTGSGKTTLGALLTRTWDGYSGSIRIDGHELSRLTPASVRTAVATVRQEVQLFSDTVRFNLTLGQTVPDARLTEAVRLARAEEVVRRLGGLDGRIEAGGRNLSAGEAQLLAMARVLAADPAIVILDEATASIDSLTEARLQEATAAVLARTTTLVIAHRLSTILDADRIVLLSDGEVIEQGTHPELLARGGAYAALFHASFDEAASPADTAPAAG